jgi:hypothetical protein
MTDVMMKITISTDVTGLATVVAGLREGVMKVMYPPFRFLTLIPVTAFVLTDTITQT